MSRDRNVLLVHLLGALAVIGWAALVRRIAGLGWPASLRRVLRPYPASLATVGAALIVPASMLLLNAPAVSRSRFPERALAPDLGRAVLTGLPPRAVVFLAGDNDSYTVWYSQQVLRSFREMRVPHQVFHLPCGHYTTGQFPFNLMDGVAMCRFAARHL